MGRILDSISSEQTTKLRKKLLGEIYRVAVDPKLEMMYTEYFISLEKDLEKAVK